MRLKSSWGRWLAWTIVAALLCAGTASAGARDPYLGVLTERGRLLLSTDGRSWRDVSPKPTSYGFDSVTFVDSKHGWAIRSDCAAGKAEVWRTTNGGQGWAGKPVPSFVHGCNAGQGIALDFVDSKHGWATKLDLQSAKLFRTADGGTTWHRIGGFLPDIGAAHFTSLTTGWLAEHNLHRTTDGGRTWKLEHLPAPPGFAGQLEEVAPPTFADSTGLTAAAFGPGQGQGGKLVVASYRTTDGGRHWRRTASWRPPVGALLFSLITISAPTPEIAWLTVYGARPHFYVTIDGGRHWLDHLLRVRAANRVIRITALDGSTAIAETSPDSGELFFVTHDGGNSWTPLPFK